MSFESNDINIALEACKIIKAKNLLPESSSITYQAPRNDLRKGTNNVLSGYYLQFDNVNSVSDDCYWVKKRFSVRLTYSCDLRTQDMWKLINKVKDCIITTCINKVPDGFEKRIFKIIETNDDAELIIDDIDKCIVINLIAYILHPNFNL